MSQANDAYTASTGLLNLITTSLFNGAAEGTGAVKLVSLARNLFGQNIPPAVVAYVVSIQNNLFGSYPNSDDLAPSIAFAAIFGILMIIHVIIFAINTSRGHYFYISLVWIVYCIMKVIGFALRADWAKDITQINKGLAGEVFLIVPVIIIVSANLILAQRLFTWRHPVGGSRKLFWAFMIILYAFVVILIAVTILASFVPYLNYLSWQSYRNWIKTVQFTAIMVIVYSLTSVALIGLSFWLPTSKDEKLYTYQPWWIESFAPFYFVKKNAAQEAEQTFMKRNSNHRHATRVIAATHHHYHSVKGLNNKRGDLTHSVSMGLLIITTLLILIAAIGRCIVVFQARQDRYRGGAANKYFMYVVWGVFEAIINILYIVGRVDLRFYRPDVLPEAVRAIITAEQTYYPSSDEEEDGFHRDRPETYAKLQERLAMEQKYNQQHHDEESAFDDDHTDDYDDINSEEWDFGAPKEKISTSSDEQIPFNNNEKKDQKTKLPYPTSHDKDLHFNDAESEFNF
ncbi:unnamed protein product [Candida verbasci]|uniref:Uncharacterized protein n=1 Tax=Candida verbasci TaxID=1227364 RepID=A0A9W4XAA2_9ASCO|nr:unnamed protein product [Candida verbasci]